MKTTRPDVTTFTDNGSFDGDPCKTPYRELLIVNCGNDTVYINFDSEAANVTNALGLILRPGESIRLFNGLPRADSFKVTFAKAATPLLCQVVQWTEIEL